jgi:hypothetical protein
MKPKAGMRKNPHVDIESMMEEMHDTGPEAKEKMHKVPKASKAPPKAKPKGKGC